MLLNGRSDLAHKGRAAFELDSGPHASDYFIAASTKTFV
jgi:hypothetical protein